MSVQNVLQGVLSQKVVADGGGGYSVKNDIVNVDTIAASSLNLSSGLSSDLNLNGKQIINDTGTLTRLGNINMNGKILSDTTGAVKLGSILDLNGNLLKNSGAGVNGFDGHIALGSPLDMNNKILTNSGGLGVYLGTTLDMASQQIINATQIRIISTAPLNGDGSISTNKVKLDSGSTQAGTVTTSGSTAATTFNIANVTSTSIVVVTPKASVGAYYVTTGTGTITITLASASAVDFNYYIAKY